MDDYARNHSYTSCDDKNRNNRGFCARCNKLSHESEDRYRTALERILERHAEGTLFPQTAANIATEALEG